MADLDVQFPPAISLGATGGPEFLTNIVVTEGGWEQRNQVWAQSRGRWSVGHAARIESQFAQLRAFFMNANGRANTFRYKDWSNYIVASGQGVFTQLTSTTFQMWRRYAFSSFSHDKKVVKPVSGTITVTGGSGASVNYATGVVTVSSGTPTAWVGQFDHYARFDTDHLDAEIINLTRGGVELVQSWPEIPIIEVRR
jgi:uncharacterized protein (TIGR02217 family)